MLITARHPQYMANFADWYKYQLTYEGGTTFIRTYLKKLSAQEKNDEYLDRLDIAYCPGFAAAAVRDINNAIHERLPDVQRIGGTPSYQRAIKSNIDLQGSSIDTFMGLQVLPQLLVYGKVGILVDNFDDLGVTLADKGDKHPYLTSYSAVNILSWAPNRPIDGFDTILLQETIDTIDESGLPNGTTVQYRYMRRTEGGVQVQFYDSTGQLTRDTTLNLRRIPFIQLEIPGSVLKDVADYQIALLNVESSDISFIRKANYPLYYEFYDPTTDSPHLKTPEHKDGSDKTIKAGMNQGRRFPKGLDAPGFTGPEPEILRVSMEKGKQIKEDIQRLVNTNISNITPGASDRSLEAGLSALGQTLQTAETQIAALWNAFEGSNVECNITYPTTFTVKTDAERLDDVGKLDKLANNVPSDTYKRAVRKMMARTLLGGVLLDKDLEKIDKEIDAAPVVSSDPNIILSAQKVGLIDDVTASDALGFDGETTVPQAKKDRAERIKLTMEAQGGQGGQARGAGEFDKGLPTSSDEKAGKDKRSKQDNTEIGGQT